MKRAYCESSFEWITGSIAVCGGRGIRGFFFNAEKNIQEKSQNTGNFISCGNPEYDSRDGTRRMGVCWLMLVENTLFFVLQNERGKNPKIQSCAK